MQMFTLKDVGMIQEANKWTDDMANCYKADDEHSDETKESSTFILQKVYLVYSALTCLYYNSTTMFVQSPMNQNSHRIFPNR